MQEMAAAYDKLHKAVLNGTGLNLSIVQHIDRVMELVHGDLIVSNTCDGVSLPERTSAMFVLWRLARRDVNLAHSLVEKIDEEGLSLGLRVFPRLVVDSPSAHILAAGCHHVLGETAGWDRCIFKKFAPLGKGIDAADHVIPSRTARLGRMEHVEKLLVKHRAGSVGSVRNVRRLSHNYLYGFSHKLRKWHSKLHFYIVDEFRDIAYPGKEKAEAMCRKRAEILRFSVDLAATSMAHRWAMLPRAMHLAVRHGSVQPMKDWGRYNFELICRHNLNGTFSKRDKSQDLI